MVPHRAFECDDILAEVSYHLRPAAPEYDPASLRFLRHTLTCAARVCRAFSHALDNLWWEIPAESCALRILCSFKSSYHDMYEIMLQSFKPESTPHELNRLRQYVTRVRQATVSAELGQGRRGSVMMRVAELLGGSLFPNLVSLNWTLSGTQFDGSIEEILNPLASPTLCCLTVNRTYVGRRLPPEWQYPFERAMLNILPTFVVKSPLLRRIDLDGRWRAFSIATLVLGSLKHLGTLSIGVRLNPRDVATLLAASNSHNLVDLSLSLLYDDYALSPLRELHLLRVIDIRFKYSTVHAAAELHNISLGWPELEEFHLYHMSVFTPEYPIDAIQALFELASACPQLRIISLPAMKHTLGSKIDTHGLASHSLQKIYIHSANLPEDELSSDDVLQAASLLEPVFPKLHLRARF
ncbi:uncharacterized protein FIBRA_00340 [Fibroporia radiculosa]|uniref:F-box domain-containing protein n=1 Tax=Fibroporia radiculosa TaxID=599839 RepID=J7RVE2_9APHY|nr:uncharacterized protein FIBRA_00340 [Fibroporia radiculosa]CCL98345.1 predicted protein [Fibroporia radiculosa]